VLTTEALADAVTGLGVRDLRENQLGQCVADIRLDRPTHEHALEEIVVALTQFGFSFVEASISEWATEMTEKAIIGALGSGAAVSPSDNLGLIVAATLIGGIVGAAIGSETHKLAAEHEARQDYWGRWVIRELPRPSSRPGLQPGLSPA
jgi:hypothetical protein